MGIFESVRDIFKVDSRCDKLALSIIEETKKICKPYIEAENAVKEAPEIVKGNEDKIKTFLKALASVMGQMSQIVEEMDSIGSLMKKNHFRDLYKSKKHEKLAAVLINELKGNDYVLPINVVQYAPRVKLFMEQIEKLLQKNQALISQMQENDKKQMQENDKKQMQENDKKQRQDNDKKQMQEMIIKNNEQIKGLLGEMESLFAKSDGGLEKYKIWIEEVNGFRSRIDKYGLKSSDKILTNCADEVNVEINNDTKAFEKLGRMQTILSSMVKDRESVDLENTYEDISLGINGSIDVFKKNLNNIKNKVSEGSNYYNSVNDKDKEILVSVFNYLNDEIEKYKWDSTKTSSENGKKFVQWADSICSELIIDNRADEEIQQWYNVMKNKLKDVKDDLEEQKEWKKKFPREWKQAINKVKKEEKG